MSILRNAIRVKKTRKMQSLAYGEDDAALCVDDEARGLGVGRLLRVKVEADGDVAVCPHSSMSKNSFF